MGITKRPASNCSDEIETVEIDELAGIIVIENNFDVLEDENNFDVLEDEDNFDILEANEDSSSEYSIHNSFTYYRDCPHLVFNRDRSNVSQNVETKPVAYKKNNVSQMGRRKANRAQNENFLLSLSDQSQHPEDEIFYNENKNGFTKAINRLCSQPELKDLFIEGNDELLLQKNNQRSVTDFNKDTKLKRSVRPELAFKNLTSSQKSLFKQKSLPIATIDYLETEVVQYFSLVPNGIYTSAPLPSYHRVLLHSIVRYYSLDAMSVNSRGHRAQKIVQVRNSYFDDFQPPRMSLLKFILKPNRCL